MQTRHLQLIADTEEDKLVIHSKVQILNRILCKLITCSRS